MRSRTSRGVEEAAKLLVPIGILLLTDHRLPADGLLVGVACGAGFAAMETARRRRALARRQPAVDG
ncbi:MAG: PrsW family glutamic-type intramembrane protease [Solirubrobacteraceae bacterium]